MPCNSQYMDPTRREKESAEVAGHLVWVLEMQAKHVTQSLYDDCDNPYGNVDELDKRTARLCKLIRKMDEQDLNEIVYDGRNVFARKLADWWEKHQEWDRRREAQETEAKQNEKLKKQALAKLTDEEKMALGL